MDKQSRDEAREISDKEMKELDNLLEILLGARVENEKSRLSSMDRALHELLEKCLADTSPRPEVNVWRSENFEALQDFISLVKAHFLCLATLTLRRVGDTDLNMDTHFKYKCLDEHIHYFDREQDNIPILFLDILIHTELLLIKIVDPSSKWAVGVAITDRLEEIDPGLKVAYIQKMVGLHHSDESWFMAVDSPAVNRHLDCIKDHMKDLIRQYGTGKPI
ncbi:predicted protein [Sclerotinia sclerotiorum 1980 UF-70]|uniref:Uncharacterized protein n=2 Tax=Sclerotinia sclerotiorum (strain ATCC 18683 / 1980 / Ss-1) TaxID=665079 RepID=A7EPG4_SCLS1|nr:predicted protein [Sclerotinia sclerotiorum 1980 UF-70]APA10325.1 hypothetical protein sscle_06g050950 [Sclerotinia sclerotiorum 1980 UF-70]EDO04730.1 predicted protein [Sclerotinia sclerotiorum 1980 UF-70]